MLEWISASNRGLTLLVSLAMLIVWLVYLQVFLVGYRRQTRPKIIINYGAGTALDARCFISNMSSEPIYVESIVAGLEAGGQNWSRPVTDVEPSDGGENADDPKKRTYQGPLIPGQYMEIGSFRSLLARVAHGGESKDEAGGERVEISALNGPVAMEILVLADYASEDLLVGARRRFVAFSRDGRWHLHSETVGTEQIRSKRKRRQLEEMLARNL
ncbi:hypothetical protein ATN84_01400 [Paramesorhizobium deserti]|uniref:Uncharacterized protein n=1 Tax=Paramesorhizobium deserti TaxID=1494590 RepID=A0A135HZ37_9HYPH|nr:hypothetical protein [Paramesorhizobium deserti]KXF78480.1 hypothetical protein ATN84_01400 [Paramesorhizobium deserti]